MERLFHIGTCTMAKQSLSTWFYENSLTWLISLVHAAFSCRDEATRITVNDGVSFGSTTSLKSRCSMSWPAPRAGRFKNKRFTATVAHQLVLFPLPPSWICPEYHNIPDKPNRSRQVLGFNSQLCHCFHLFIIQWISHLALPKQQAPDMNCYILE